MLTLVLANKDIDNLKSLPVEILGLVKSRFKVVAKGEASVIK